MLRALATEWRALVAGGEGFLTGGRRGLEGQQVVWGEMDSFVRLFSLLSFLSCALCFPDGMRRPDGPWGVDLRFGEDGGVLPGC